MSWFRVDDTLHAHRKVMKAGAEAMGLWVVCGSFVASSASRGDGTIDRDEIRGRALLVGVTDCDAAIERLVTAGLWDDLGNGLFSFHDFHDYATADGHLEAKKSKEEARRKAKDAARAKAYRERKSVTERDGKRDASRDGSRDGERDEEQPSRDGASRVCVTHAPDAHASRDPVPSRPVPDLPPTPQGGTGPVELTPIDPPTGDRSEVLSSLRTVYSHVSQAITATLPAPIHGKADYDALEVLWAAAQRDEAKTFAAWLTPRLRAWVESVRGTPDARFVRGWAPSKLQERLASGQDAPAPKPAASEWLVPEGGGAPRTRLRRGMGDVPPVASIDALPAPKAVP